MAKKKNYTAGPLYFNVNDKCCSILNGLETNTKSLFINRAIEFFSETIEGKVFFKDYKGNFTEKETQQKEETQKVNNSMQEW